MYQAWPWGGTAAAASPTAGYVQPTASTAQVATAQWPAGYGQYAVTPEMQQQWAAAWASQAQYAYSTVPPTGEAQPATAFAGAYPDYQTAAVTSSETKPSETKNDAIAAAEIPKTAPEQSAPNLGESDKLKQLKEQAEKWTSLQQPAASSWSYSTAATNASTGTNVTVTAPNVSAGTLASTNVTHSGAPQPTQMTKEEEEFERQFKDWEKQFEAWKQQNQNHPDKEAFAQYEKQWQEWREQLLQKKEQMQRAKAEQAASSAAVAAQPTTSMMSTNANSANYTNTTVSNTTPGMYYQPAQYMYMQPYMYPGGTAVAPGAVVPPAAGVPPTVVPSAGVQPVGMPPGSMPPTMMPPTGVQPQIPYSAPPNAPNNFGNRAPPQRMPGHGDGMQPHDSMNYDNQRPQDFDDRDMYNYGPSSGPDPGRRNGPGDEGMGQAYEGYDSPYMGEEDFQRDSWNFGRGGGGGGPRGRGGRGRARGRGGHDRWSEPPDMDARPGGMRNQRKTLLPGGPPGGLAGGPPALASGPSRRIAGGPPVGLAGGPNVGIAGAPPGRLAGGPPVKPTGGPLGGPGSFDKEDSPPPFEYPTEDCRDQFGQLPEDAHEPSQNNPDDGFYNNDGPFPPYDENFSGEGFPERFLPDRKRFLPDERFPPNDRFMPDQEGFPPDEEGFPPVGFPDREEFPPDEGMFPPDQERFPPKGGRFPPGDERFPPDDSGFPGDDHGFPPGRGRFPPPRHMMEEGRFGGREFDQFPPPEDEMFGPPPFHDEFPPFDERGPRGRGRFPSRGGRGRFQRDFDRFGGPTYPPRMGNEPFGPPDYPPDDRFGFPDEVPPPRGMHPRGMRPPFEPPFGPGDRFGPGGGSEDRFFEEGPSRYKTIDYTHRSAAAVMGDDFDSHYEFEEDFQDDVNAFRDNFNSGEYVAPLDPIIFSEVNTESFDYGHGLKPMTTTTIPAKESIKDNAPLPTDKGFDYPFNRDRSPYHDRILNSNRLSDFPERERDRESLRDRDRSRDRDSYRPRERDRSRDRSDRDRDRDRKENIRDRDRDSYDKDRGKDKDRGERDLKRDRDWRDDQKRDDDDNKRFKWSKNRENERDFSKDKNRSSSNGKKESDSKTVEAPMQFKPQPNIFKNDSSETVLIEDILVEPKRSLRPKQLVIILRGLPGSGKTYFAKLIKDKEIENGGSAPRILSLDDYFMVETEVTETDPDTGKRIKKKEFKFEYELEMEEAYRSSLFKSFKKTIDDRFFPFIIVDAVHDKSKHYEQYWSYAKQKGFQVYIAEMDCKDPVICHKRNIHSRALEDINKILKNWESKPRHFIGMDVRSLLQDVSITEVEMEVEGADKSAEDNGGGSADEDSQENPFLGHEPSRWEKLEATEEKLDQLDGLRVASKKKQSSMEDYLQLPDDYDDRKCEPGKKRVRWADLEQRKEQDRLRAIGFVVGQTDWTKLTDPSQADKALTKTKYF